MLYQRNSFNQFVLATMWLWDLLGECILCLYAVENISHLKLVQNPNLTESGKDDNIHKWQASCSYNFKHKEEGREETKSQKSLAFLREVLTTHEKKNQNEKKEMSLSTHYLLLTARWQG